MYPDSGTLFAVQVVLKSQILAGGRGLGKFKSGLQVGPAAVLNNTQRALSWLPATTLSQLDPSQA